MPTGEDSGGCNPGDEGALREEFLCADYCSLGMISWEVICPGFKASLRKGMARCKIVARRHNSSVVCRRFIRQTLLVSDHVYVGKSAIFNVKTEAHIIGD